MGPLLEEHSSSEASCSDQETDNDDMYGDLDFPAGAISASQSSQDAWSATSEVDDVDIFQEMGVQPLEYTTEEGSVDYSAAYKRTREKKPALQGASGIDFQALREVLRASQNGESSISDLKENRNVSEICENKSKSREDSKRERSCDREDETISGRVSSNKILTENKQLGSGSHGLPVSNGQVNTENAQVGNKDMQFVLSLLSRKMDVNMDALKQSNPPAVNKTFQNSATSIANTSNSFEDSDSSRSPRKSKRISEKQKNTTPNKLVPTTSHQSLEKEVKPRTKRLPTSSFLSVKVEKSPSRKAESQMDLFEDFIVNRNQEETNREVGKVKKELDLVRSQLEESQKRCEDLEEDNHTLLSNISSLWKTSLKQIREKIQEINLLKAEREAILFRRAMRQVPKDEIDRIVSRIQAYSSEEFKSFMENMQKNTEESTCNCGNKKSTSQMPMKGSLTQMMTASATGIRVNAAQDTDAAALKSLMGKEGEKVTTALNNPQTGKVKMKRKLSAQRLDDRFSDANDFNARHHTTRDRCDSTEKLRERTRNNSGDTNSYSRSEYHGRHNSDSTRHRHGSGDMQSRQGNYERPAKRRRHDSGERHVDSRHRHNSGDRVSERLDGGRRRHGSGDKDSRHDRHSNRYSDLGDDPRKRNSEKTPGKSPFEKKKSKECKAERDDNEEHSRSEKRGSVFSRLGLSGANKGTNKKHLDKVDQRQEERERERGKQNKTSRHGNALSDENTYDGVRTSSKRTEDRNRHLLAKEENIGGNPPSGIAAKMFQMAFGKDHHLGSNQLHLTDSSAGERNVAQQNDKKPYPLGYGPKKFPKDSRKDDHLDPGQSHVIDSSNNHILVSECITNNPCPVDKQESISNFLRHDVEGETINGCKEKIEEEDEEEMLGKSLFGQRMIAKMAKAKQKQKQEQEREQVNLTQQNQEHEQVVMVQQKKESEQATNTSIVVENSVDTESIISKVAIEESEKSKRINESVKGVKLNIVERANKQNDTIAVPIIDNSQSAMSNVQNVTCSSDQKKTSGMKPTKDERSENISSDLINRIDIRLNDLKNLSDIIKNISTLNERSDWCGEKNAVQSISENGCDVNNVCEQNDLQIPVQEREKVNVIVDESKLSNTEASDMSYPKLSVSIDDRNMDEKNVVKGDAANNAEENVANTIEQVDEDLKNSAVEGTDEANEKKGEMKRKEKEGEIKRKEKEGEVKRKEKKAESDTNDQRKDLEDREKKRQTEIIGKISGAGIKESQRDLERKEKMGKDKTKEKKQMPEREDKEEGTKTKEKKREPEKKNKNEGTETKEKTKEPQMKHKKEVAETKQKKREMEMKDNKEGIQTREKQRASEMKGTKERTEKEEDQMRKGKQGGTEGTKESTSEMISKKEGEEAEEKKGEPEIIDKKEGKQTRETQTTSELKHTKDRTETEKDKDLIRKGKQEGTETEERTSEIRSKEEEEATEKKGEPEEKDKKEGKRKRGRPSASKLKEAKEKAEIRKDEQEGTKTKESASEISSKIEGEEAKGVSSRRTRSRSIRLKEYVTEEEQSYGNRKRSKERQENEENTATDSKRHSKMKEEPVKNQVRRSRRKSWANPENKEKNGNEGYAIRTRRTRSNEKGTESGEVEQVGIRTRNRRGLEVKKEQSEREHKEEVQKQKKEAEEVKLDEKAVIEKSSTKKAKDSDEMDDGQRGESTTHEHRQNEVIDKSKKRKETEIKECKDQLVSNINEDDDIKEKGVINPKLIATEDDDKLQYDTEAETLIASEKEERVTSSKRKSEEDICSDLSQDSASTSKESGEMCPADKSIQDKEENSDLSNRIQDLGNDSACEVQASDECLQSEKDVNLDLPSTSILAEDKAREHMDEACIEERKDDIEKTNLVKENDKTMDINETSQSQETPFEDEEKIESAEVNQQRRESEMSDDKSHKEEESIIENTNCEIKPVNSCNNIKNMGDESHCVLEKESDRTENIKESKENHTETQDISLQDSMNVEVSELTAPIIESNVDDLKNSNGSKSIAEQNMDIIESLFPEEEELLYEYSCDEFSNSDDSDEEKEFDGKENPDLNATKSVNKQQETIKSNEGTVQSNSDIKDSFTSNEGQSIKNVTKGDVEVQHDTSHNKCISSPKKNSKTDNQKALPRSRSPSASRPIRRITRLTSPNKKEKDNEIISPLMVREKEMQAKHDEQLAKAFGRKSLSPKRSMRQQQKKSEDLEDVESEQSPPLHHAQRRRGKVSRRRESESPPRERGGRHTRNKSDEHRRMDQEKIHSERDILSRRGECSERASRRRREGQEGARQNRSSLRGRSADSDEDMHHNMRHKRQPPDSPQRYRREYTGIRSRSGDHRVKEKDHLSRGNPLAQNKNRTESKDPKRKDVNLGTKEYKEKEKEESKVKTKIVPVDSKLLHSVLTDSPKKNIDKEGEKEEGELDDDEEEGEVHDEEPRRKRRSHKDPKESRHTKTELDRRRRDSSRKDERDKKYVHQSEITKYEQALREAKEKHQKASEERQKKLQKKQTTKEPTSGRDNKADLEKAVATKSKLEEKLASKVTDANIERRKQRMKARHMRNMVEDDTTFYPSDLFQVIPILSVPEKSIGVASGSEDTIDILVKQNNEKYKQDSLSTSGDSEMSLLHFIEDHEDESLSPTFKPSVECQDVQENSLKVTAGSNVETTTISNEEKTEHQDIRSENVDHIRERSLNTEQDMPGIPVTVSRTVSEVQESLEEKECNGGKELEMISKDDKDGENAAAHNDSEVQCSDEVFPHESKVIHHAITENEGNSSSDTSDSESDSDSDSSDCDCSKCGNSSSSSSSSSSSDSASDSDTNDRDVPNVSLTNTPAVVGVEEVGDQRGTIRNTPRKSPRKTPSKHVKSPKKVSPAKSPHTSCKTPHKLIKTPHKSPRKAEHKTPCKKLGKTPRKSPNIKLRHSIDNTSQAMTDVSKSSQVSVLHGKDQGETSIVSPVNDQWSSSEHSLCKSQKICPQTREVQENNKDVTRTSQMKISSFHDNAAVKNQDNGSSTNSQPQDQRDILSTTTSSSNKQKVFIRRRARRPANFSPTSSSANQSVISFIHVDRQTPESNVLVTSQSENIFTASELKEQDTEEQSNIRKRNRSPTSAMLEKTTAIKHQRIKSPDIGKVKNHNAETEDNTKQTNPHEKIPSLESPSTSEKMETKDKPTNAPSPPKIVVPVKIRRVKRQLNLGLSSSVMSVVSTVPEKKSPQKETNTILSSSPPEEEKRKLPEEFSQSPRRSPRKKSVPI